MRLALTQQPSPVLSARADDRRTLHELDDGHLARRHLAGDPQAFGALVDRYQTRLLKFINRTIGDREQAEDLVQEVFIRVFRHMHRFDRTKKFSSWIYTIASNLGKNELRRRSHHPVVLHQALEVEDPSTRPDHRFRRNCLADAVTRSLRQLPEFLRNVFVLRELEGMSYEEIGVIAGCKVGTVKSRLNRARNSFARLVQPLLE